MFSIVTLVIKVCYIIIKITNLSEKRVFLDFMCIIEHGSFTAAHILLLLHDLYSVFGGQLWFSIIDF